MSKDTDLSAPPSHVAEPDTDLGRRDFLYIATGSVATFGTALAAWPFIDSMNPSRNVLSLANLDVDIARIPVGQAITVRWRGKPVFIRHRSASEINAARNVDLASLPDPQDDTQRVKKPEWLVTLGVCTHLGCIPLGNKPGEPRGDWDGWFCVCHGSQYDTSGRIRQGPAPTNLQIPPYTFIDDHTLRLGTDTA